VLGCVGSCFIVMFRRYLISIGKPFFSSLSITMIISLGFLCDVTRRIKKRYAANSCYVGLVGGKTYSSRLVSVHQCLKSNLRLISSQDTTIHFFKLPTDMHKNALNTLEIFYENSFYTLQLVRSREIRV
jgi:hypothetical protein